MVVTWVSVDTQHMYHQIERSRDEIELDLLQVGSEPVGVRCPHCQEDVMSRVEYKITMCTHAIALIMGIFLWLSLAILAPNKSERQYARVERGPETNFCPEDDARCSDAEKFVQRTVAFKQKLSFGGVDMYV
ncbi:unnamed protein product [Chilo suppressalis]|uniref:LITAF domain-containing protein n=1 Tax=Chilo suppressalis TaxID=168631 RepID=A0ABN8BCC7_CHISP|nr:unnamed protein product [Chilo suppressalis]